MSSGATQSLNAADLVRLMHGVAARDRSAFKALYEATASKLYGIVLRILVRRELADEVLQEVYVKIWERAGDYQSSRASPITWMATIARNRALDEVRRAKPVYLEDMPKGFDIAADLPHPLDGISSREDYARLLGCLQGLEAKRRDIVVGAYLNGSSREQLSQEHGVPVPTIKTWLHRSLAQLKKCLAS